MNDFVAFIADICAILLFLAAVSSVVVRFYKRYRVYWNWQILVAFLIKFGIVISLAVYIQEYWVSLGVSVGMSIVIILASESTGRLYERIIVEQRSLYNEAVSAAIDATNTAEEALQILRDMRS